MPAVQTLAVKRRRDGEVDVLSIEGEIDIATAPRLISALNDAVLETAVPLVVDLTRVAFMDSTGLALLLNAHRRVVRRGLGFAVVCPQGPLHRVFELTDMIDTLRVRFDTATASAAALARASA